MQQIDVLSGKIPAEQLRSLTMESHGEGFGFVQHLTMMVRLVVVTEGKGISLVYASTSLPNAQLTSQKLN